MCVRTIIVLFIALIYILPKTGYAHADHSHKITCDAQDSMCLLDVLEKQLTHVEDPKWRDQIYREVAKLYMASNKPDRAIAIIEKIGNHDTKALTIRGIGFAAAKLGLAEEELTAIFNNLSREAEKIEHEASHAIALTYISMAESLAERDQQAVITANNIGVAALRNKAHAENAEIQAERGAFDAAFTSISHIDDAAFRDRAFRLISNIFVKQGDFQKALNAANSIANEYERARAVLEIVSKQVTPEEVSVLP